ncbi:hypothetical protein X777_12806 [Ooceraea biroi]|uniref:CCHC-type domain-containing protein n=1 Tax=Ooceraea biroi TaxID=2015173 RepID=A0A026VZ37_OOCBI|nr:hypothetical protein X777_12806 [Ooceraea biroi]
MDRERAPCEKVSTFITVWNSKKPTKQMIENLANELAGHEEVLNKADNELEVLVVKSRKDISKGNDKKKSNKKIKAERREFSSKCYNCGMEDHIMHDCTEPKKNKKSQNKNMKNMKLKRTEAFMINSVESSWLGDSGTNCHMTYDRSCFEMFEEVFNHPGIGTANKVAVLMKWRGTVRVFCKRPIVEW